jgi:lipoyl(octanoyl) transferase
MKADERRETGPRLSLLVELPETGYEDAYAFQRSLVDARVSGTLERDVFIFLEHFPVFTLGRRGGKEYVTVPEEFFEKAGIPVVQTDRGGTITYHGPGQVIMYPIVALREARLKVVEFVDLLEEVMIRTAARFNVSASRDSRNRGVWVGPRKLGSIGLAVHRGVTCHGFAFNVNPNLEPFSWIDPCGLDGVRMTSLAVERSTDVQVQDVLPVMKENVEVLFGTRLDPTAQEQLAGLITSV